MINIIKLDEIKNKIKIINEVMKNNEEVYFINNENEEVYVLINYKKYKNITENEFCYNNYIDKIIKSSRNQKNTFKDKN